MSLSPKLANIVLFMHPSSNLPAEYAEAFWSKWLPCDKVYDKYILQGIFIKGLPKSIRHSMCSYWGSKKSAVPHELAPHATYVSKLQHDLQSSDTARQHGNIANWR